MLFLRFFASFLAMALISIPLHGQTQAKASVIGNGGAITSGTSYQLKSTLGQTVIGTSQSISQNNALGFWYQASAAGNVVGIAPIAGLPGKFQLFANYPNPFNPATTISFSLEKKAFTTLKVYNSLGQLVAVLVNEALPAGQFDYQWHAANLTSGVYYYQLSAGNFFSQTRKMLLVR